MGNKTIEKEKSVKWTGCVEGGVVGHGSVKREGRVGLVKCGGGERFEGEVWGGGGGVNKGQGRDGRKDE